jgi:hypothetical protein
MKENRLAQFAGRRQEIGPGGSLLFVGAQYHNVFCICHGDIEYPHLGAFPEHGLLGAERRVAGTDSQHQRQMRRDLTVNPIAKNRRYYCVESRMRSQCLKTKQRRKRTGDPTQLLHFNGTMWLHVRNSLHTLSNRMTVPMRFGIQPKFCKRSILAFAKALIAACIVFAHAVAAESPNTTVKIDAMRITVQGLTEQCRNNLAVQDLDPIRTKADLSRMADEGPPPFRIAFNDTFATDSERAVIAKWIKVWSHCRSRFELPHFESPPANATVAASLQQVLSRIFHSSVGQCIRALYYQELTYGEFASKRYEFTRDAVALSSAIAAAELDPNQERLEQAFHKLQYMRLSWNTYLRRINARQPGKVHIRGAIST